MTGLRPRQASSCPAMLAGSETRIAMTPLGVDVTVTSKDAAIEHKIVALARFHARGETADRPRPHDGLHGAAGRVGYCPIIVGDMTHVTMTVIPGGATVHVAARSALRVKELQEMIKARAERVPGYLSS